MPSGDDLGICATWDDLSNLENWNLGQKPNPSFFDACGRSRDVVYGILIVRTLRVFFALKKSMVFRHFPALGGLEPLGNPARAQAAQDQSILIYRIYNTEPGIMMPEIGRSINHNEGVDLISEYIKNLTLVGSD